MGQSATRIRWGDFRIVSPYSIVLHLFQIRWVLHGTACDSIHRELKGKYSAKGENVPQYAVLCLCRTCSILHVCLIDLWVRYMCQIMFLLLPMVKIIKRKQKKKLTNHVNHLAEGMGKHFSYAEEVVTVNSFAIDEITQKAQLSNGYLWYSHPWSL